MPTEIHIFSQNHPRRNHKNDRISSRISISKKTTIKKRSRKIKKRLRKGITQYHTTEDSTLLHAAKTVSGSEYIRIVTECEDTTITHEVVREEDLERPRQKKTKKKPDENEGDTLVIVSTLVVQTVKRTAQHAYRALSY